MISSYGGYQGPGYYGGNNVRGFDFGAEVSKIRSYVEEQLNGEETRKNYQILKKFQQEAELQKHKKLYSRSLNHNISLPPAQNGRYYTIAHEGQGMNNSRGSDRRRKFDLVPASRHIPPIYNYSNSTPIRMGVMASETLEPPPKHLLLDSNNKMLRGQSTELQPCSDHLVPQKGSLRKIKEIAAQRKKEGVMHVLSKPCQDQKLIAELEEEKDQHKRQYRALSKKLFKLKKYRFKLKQMEYQNQ